MIAAGKNLKRLLSKRGWGRRPLPSGAALHWAVHVLFIRAWSMQTAILAAQVCLKSNEGETLLVSYQ